jgi:hypothetical protein
MSRTTPVSAVSGHLWSLRRPRQIGTGAFRRVRRALPHLVPSHRILCTNPCTSQLVRRVWLERGAPMPTRGGDAGDGFQEHPWLWSATAATCVVGVLGWLAVQDHPAYIPRLAAWARALRELIGAALRALAEALYLLGSCLDDPPSGSKAARTTGARPGTGRTEGHRRHPSYPASRDSPGHSPRVATRRARPLPLAREQPDVHLLIVHPRRPPVKGPANHSPCDLLIRRYPRGCPVLFRSVRDLGRSTAACSVAFDCFASRPPRWLPRWLPTTTPLSECRLSGLYSGLVAVTCVYTCLCFLGYLPLSCAYTPGPQRSRAVVGPSLGIAAF